MGPKEIAALCLQYGPLRLFIALKVFFKPTVFHILASIEVRDIGFDVEERRFVEYIDFCEDDRFFWVLGRGV